MTSPENRLTRRQAERILDHRGDPTESVARVVDAAASPAPVAGEERAAALFRAATGLVPVATSGGPSAMTRLTRRFTALPAAGIAAVVLTVGGGSLAFAATHGAVNVPFTGHDNRSEHAPAAPATSNPGLAHTVGAPSGAAPTGAPGTHLPSASPSPSLQGLCRAYQAGAVPRKATNPAFAALSAAAGGSESVSSYCTGLIGTPTKPTKPTHPAPTHPSPTHPSPTHPSPDHASTPPVPLPTQAASPTKPSKPKQAATPTIPPRPTRTAHE